MLLAGLGFRSGRHLVDDASHRDHARPLGDPQPASPPVALCRFIHYNALSFTSTTSAVLSLPRISLFN
jgi:hypothetical protein